MKGIAVCLVFVMTAALRVSAQSVLDGPLTWHAAAFVDLYDQVEHAAQFIITTSSDSITLHHDGCTKTFDIVSSSGVWQSSGEDGELVCNVSQGSTHGTVTLARYHGTFTVTVDFSSYPQGIKRKFITSPPIP